MALFVVAKQLVFHWKLFKQAPWRGAVFWGSAKKNACISQWAFCIVSQRRKADSDVTTQSSRTHCELAVIGGNWWRRVVASFRLPTDIQAESIPLILGGGDVLMVRTLCPWCFTPWILIGCCLITCMHFFFYGTFFQLFSAGCWDRKWKNWGRLEHTHTHTRRCSTSYSIALFYCPRVDVVGLQHPSDPDRVRDSDGSAGGEERSCCSEDRRSR